MSASIIYLTLILMRIVSAADELDHCSEVQENGCHDNTIHHDEAPSGNITSRTKRSLRSIFKIKIPHLSKDVYKNKLFHWDTHYIRLNEGDTLRLNCCVKMPPKPDEKNDLIWWHNDMSLNATGYRIQSRFPQLVITGMVQNDNGVYWTKRFDKAKSVTYSVTVFTSRPVIRSRAGKNVVFPCHNGPLAEVWGRLRLTWLHNGSVFSFTERPSSVDYRLVLYNVNMDANGRWQCVAMVSATLTSWITNEGVLHIIPKRPGWHDLVFMVERFVTYKIIAFTTVITLLYFLFKCIVFEGTKYGYRIMLYRASKRYKKKLRRTMPLY
ncbi:hypothetical protein LSH36_87g06052 [Paralvinella palmiformis]|uniref:Immunoglobulin domain-containing protein n=1 Tax=Paralvinella palmiformis TaxID=53620 RepID=A0AAD9NAL9_9ANNE|nr:hypothetical protein LSH36_87g06052 [Paralvinella palmiformis]